MPRRAILSTCFTQKRNAAALCRGTGRCPLPYRYVAFQSKGNSLAAGDTNGEPDVFVRDRLLGTTERVSVSTNGSGGAQGSVRCAGGELKRLYNKIASGGSITAPDFNAGDPAVSVRSAALGDPIASGESRWYLVYYRDPTVLGGCPSSSTFNATQTGEVVWVF